ncbi:Heat-labile enterotoxin IIA, A chain, partial [Metarhizium brunneum ARSEF 3297]
MLTGTRLQPNLIVQRSKTLPELAAEALLKLGKLSAYKQTRSLVTLDIILPLSQSSFDRLKQWDHPIGRAAKAFDDAITSMQEAIGGEQVPEIFGNKLKLRIICYLRGEQRYKSAVDYACERLHGSNEQQALEQENEMRDKLVQLFEDCGDATKTDEQNDLLQVCDELSRKTLDLEQATEELIAFRKQLQQKFGKAASVCPEVRIGLQKWLHGIWDL